MSAAAIVAGGLVLSPISTTPAAALPAGFVETTAFSGLSQPTVVKFASDGRVFVAEKNGLIKVFDNLSDSTPTVFADLRTNVHNYWDRGLLGMTLHPNFPTTPYVYVLYTYDAAIGESAPRWGSPGVSSDPCPTPPGPTDDGCVVSGRLSRLEASGNTMTGSEQVLINDWCQQYPSHSAGTLDFGADGMLYVSAGDGASFIFTDYGQDGSPVNPCGDPGGDAPTPPTAEGGALRSQDVRTLDDPTGLDGTILRVHPETGEGVSGNPMFTSSDANARRIVATGLRNPFRMARRPGTNELWIGDVGWHSWEEINRLVTPADGVVDNFGWPCYEGVGRQPGYDSADLALCEGLYAEGSSAVVAPVLAYPHDSSLVPNDGCTVGSSSTAGIAFEFYAGNAYPAEYQGALFFADYSRKCIWVMMRGADGLPNPGDIRPFHNPANGGPVNLEFSPAGELFYPGFDDGTVKRIRYIGTSTITCNTGEFKAEYFSGTALGTTPVFSRCEPAINYSWGSGGPGNGLPNDRFSVRWTGTHAFAGGTYQFAATADDGIRVWVDDAILIDQWRDQAATTFTATRTLAAGEHSVRVEYYENTGSAVARVSWAASGGAAPTAVIDTPPADATWKVGDVLSFSGHATDPEQGTLPASALSWDLVMQHCPSTCHAHPLQSYPGVAAGEFTAPDHDYPSYLELRLTATDAQGNTSSTTRRLNPSTVDLTFQTAPAGLQLTVGASSATAPFTRTVIVGSSNSITANSPQALGTSTYTFSSWSDGGAQSHNIVAPATATTYTAEYTASTATYQRYAWINFQPARSSVPSGYLVDSGGAYAARNGLTYGWTATNNSAKDRNSSLSPDQRYDTLIHTQQPKPATWEIAVPNGEYLVRVVAGDPAAYDSVYRVAAEGVLAVDATPTTASRWAEGTVVVTVADGRLTIGNASGAVNNKLAFLEIARRT